MTVDLDKLIAKINKDLTPEGAARPVASRGENIQRPEFIPCSSPALGYILGNGGWFKGKLHEFYGPEHAGKTTLALLALKDCLAAEPDKAVAFIDVEHRFNASWAETLGLTIGKNLVLIQPPDGESATDAMVTLIKSQQISAMVFDSIGSAQPNYANEMFSTNPTRKGGNAALMKRNVNTVSPLANLYGVTMFYINQLLADMDGYHRIMTPGGNAVKHAMDLRLYIRPGKEKFFIKNPLAGDNEGKDLQVGYAMLFKTTKNSFGPAFREQYSDFYNVPSALQTHVGFDVDKDYARLGILMEIITRGGGGMYYYDGHQSQGRDNFFVYLREHGLYDGYIEAVRARIVKGDAPGAQEDMPESAYPDEVSE